MNTDTSIKFSTRSALIAAIYAMMVLVFRPISFDLIQFRVAEVLTVLPMFTPAAIPGLFAGCALSGIIGGAAWSDVLFGSLATLVAALLSYLLRKWRWLVPLPPVLCNTLAVPLILKFGYGVTEAIPVLMCTVFLGEVLVCYLLGMGLITALKRLEGRIF